MYAPQVSLYEPEGVADRLPPALEAAPMMACTSCAGTIDGERGRLRGHWSAAAAEESTRC